MLLDFVKHVSRAFLENSTAVTWNLLWCISILGLLGEADHSFLGNLVLNFLFFFINGALLDITSTITTPGLFCIMEKDKCEKEKHLYFTLPVDEGFFLIVL